MQQLTFRFSLIDGRLPGSAIDPPPPPLSCPSALKRKASNEILKRNIKLAIGHCSWLKVLHIARPPACVCVGLELLLWPLCLARGRAHVLGLGESRNQ